MAGVTGLALLVCVSGIGLAKLAASGRAGEHLFAVGVMAVVAMGVAVASPAAAVLILLGIGLSFRLRPVVPSRVPREWAGS